MQSSSKLLHSVLSSDHIGREHIQGGSPQVFILLCAANSDLGVALFDFALFSFTLNVFLHAFTSKS